MSRKILLADDSITIQKVIELTFMDDEYEVESVSNGDAALERFGQLQPDIVIADIHMPGASGYEVCRQVKAARPDVPVLLLVGTFEPFEEGEAEASGADSYLKKPFDSQELMRLVEGLLPAAAEEAEPELAGSGDFVRGDDATADSTDADETWSGTRSRAGFDSGEWRTSAADGLEIASDDEAPAERSDDAEEDLEGESWEALEIPPADEGRAAEATAGGEEQMEPTTEVEVVFAAEEDEVEVEGAHRGAEAERTEDALEGVSAWGALPDDLDQPEREPEHATPEDAAAEAAAAEIGAAELGSAEPAAAELAAAETSTPEAPAAEVVTPEAEPAPGSGQLSDHDVERIAQRVVELLSKKAVQDIAWEVVPDLAEIVIRDRLDELESQLESQPPS